MNYDQWRADLDHARGDADRLYHYATELLGIIRFLSDAKPKRRAEGTTRATWLTPIQVAWDAEMGAGTFPFGPAAKALAPLYRAGHTPETIGKHIGYYCRDLIRRDKVAFASLPQFAKTFKNWNPDDPAFVEDD